MEKILYYTIEHSPLRNLLIDAAALKIKKIFKINNVKKIKINYSRIPSLKLFVFKIINILNLQFFNERKYILLRYKSFEIGRYAASYTYKIMKCLIQNFWKFT